MVERGFEYSFGMDAIPTYIRTVGSLTQILALVTSIEARGSNSAWVVNAVKIDGVGGYLVVRHSEGFTSPVTAFVTAEVRQWKTQ